VVHAILEARRAAPAILYMPHMQVCGTSSPCARDTMRIDMPMQSLRMAVSMPSVMQKRKP
jgi:hypothetical protein